MQPGGVPSDARELGFRSPMDQLAPQGLLLTCGPNRAQYGSFLQQVFRLVLVRL